MLDRVSGAASERRDLSSEFSDKSSAISDAMRLVRLAAEPRPAGDSVKAAIRRAAIALHWSPSRARDIWYGQARVITSREMDALRTIERKHASGEHRKYIEQIAALRARLATRDAEFHRADCLALDWMLTEITRRD